MVCRTLVSVSSLLFLFCLIQDCASFQPRNPLKRRFVSKDHSLVQISNPKNKLLYSTASSSTTNEAPNFLDPLYTIGSYAFGIMGLFVLVIPDRTFASLLASKLGGAAGLGVAAALCRILQNAHRHQRLASDTYKRLHLGLLVFSGIGLAALPGEGGFVDSVWLCRSLAGGLTIAKSIGVLIGSIGWYRGVAKDGALTVRAGLDELWKGTKETLQGLRVQDAKKALTYRNYMLLVVFGAFSSFMEGLFYIRYRSAFERTMFEISLQWSGVARLAMLTTLIYSLKDAAERDRLTGTTFQQLNMLVGGWAVLVGLGQAVYPLGFAFTRGVAMFTLAFPFFLRAYKAQQEKLAQAEKKTGDADSSGNSGEPLS